MTAPLVITVDGPAASGKGTIARALAARRGLAFLDTGALYRRVALSVLDARGDPADAEAAAKAAQAIDPAAAEDPRIRTAEAGAAASVVAAHREVRAALLEFQRRFAANPPGGRGAVLDGRDCGTVIAPHADVKLFVTAAPETRARRRMAELEALGEAVDYAALLTDIRARDARDSGRADAPLAPAPDAVLLDTSDLSIDAALAAAEALVEQALQTRASPD